MGCSASERVVRGDRWPSFGVAAVVLALSGCAGLGGSSPDRVEPDRVEELEKRVAATEDALSKQDARLSELEAEGGKEGSSDQGLRQRLDKLQSRLKQLEGSTEVNGHELGRLSQQLQEIHDELDQRLSSLERDVNRLEEESLSRSTAASPPPQRETEPPESSKPSQQNQSPSRPEDYQRYQAAFDKLQDGQYDSATESFRQFLGDYPESQYVPNAHYWLGEAHYVQQDYEQALEAFQKVQKQFPDSNKVPDALLKEGFAYYQLEDYRMARKTLLEVTDRFPDHRVANLARDRLDQIRQEQR